MYTFKLNNGKRGDDDDDDDEGADCGGVCCRAVGTFARALDCSSSIRQPSLHMSAAAASRDITLVRHTHIHTLNTHAVKHDTTITAQ